MPQTFRNQSTLGLQLKHFEPLRAQDPSSLSTKSLEITAEVTGLQPLHTLEITAFRALATSHLKPLHTVGAKIITELIFKTAGPVIFETFLLELMAFRMIPVICPAKREQNLEIYLETIINSRQGTSRNKINNFSKIMRAKNQQAKHIIFDRRANIVCVF